MLSDMETCYKVMRTEVLRSMTLQSNGFGIEPELTAKIFKRALPGLRSADHVRRPRLRRGEEDHLARRRRRALGAPEIPVYRVNPLPRLLAYSRPYRWRFVAAFVAMIVYARGVGGRGAADRADHRPRAADARRISAFWATLILVAYFFKGLGAYCSTYLMTDIGQQVVRDIRNQLFRHILDQSAGFFGRRTSGQLMSRITNDVNQVQQAVSETIGDLIREGAVAHRLRCAAVLLRLRGWRSSASRARRSSSTRWSGSGSACGGRRGGARRSSSGSRTSPARRSPGIAS